jgi:hypothetical protein
MRFCYKVSIYFTDEKIQREDLSFECSKLVILIQVKFDSEKAEFVQVKFSD